MKVCDPVVRDVSYNEIKHSWSKVLDGTFRKYECNGCHKVYKHRQSLYNHSKVCSHLSSSNPSLTAGDTIINNIDASTTNNIDASTTNNVGNSFNFNINPFGKEDMSHITHEEMGRVISMRYEGLMEFAKLLYKNKKNLNVFIPNVSRNTGLVYRPPNWEPMREDAITDVVVQRGADMISDYMEDNVDLINGTDYFMMDKALTDIQKDRRENMKRRGDVRRVIEDNGHRKRVWDNFKDASNGELIVPPVSFD